MDDNCVKNTDREIWREKEEDFYSPSIHVTEQGKIGINVGGYVIIKPIQDWHKCQGQLRLQTDVAMGAKSIAAQLQGENERLKATIQNALVSLAVMSMRREDNNVAINEDLLKIMADSFREALKIA